VSLAPPRDDPDPGMSSPLDAVPGGVLVLSNDMRITAANRTMGALASRDPSELIGHSLDILLSGPSRILFQTHVYPALTADGRVEEVFLTLAQPTGETLPVLLNAVRSSDGTEPTYDALIVRIRARSQWERDLLAATRAIERERAASQRLAEELATAAEDLAARSAEEQRNREFRDAFIGVLSHELRTPITTIYGMSHLLQQRHATMEPDAVGHHLADIVAESDRLRRLTEDLLVLSRAEGGELHVAANPIVIGPPVRRAADGERARAAAHRFDVEIAPRLPLVVGEELYVEQVVRNFLTNATKYSPPDTTIRIAAVAEDEGVVVRVLDEGPGLGGQPPEKLFDLFYRAPEAIRETAGAGIGLFVCRELVHAMGGRVWAATAPQGGAEFGFWLPAAIEES
jgi:K+-sensing histidine kinase KdpD